MLPLQWMDKKGREIESILSPHQDTQIEFSNNSSSASMREQLCLSRTPYAPGRGGGAQDIAFILRN